jgi:RNA polymerase sigma factor (sigma-70 family)
MLSFKNLSEQDLIVAYSNGHEPAINELINRTHGKLYTAIYLLVKDKYLAEDFVQDTYVKAIKKLREGAYLNDGKFMAWLSCIGRNLCMDYFRVSNKNIKVTMKNGRDVFDVLEFEDSNIEAEIISEQSANTMHKMLELIPFEQREVVMLRLFCNMSFSEIAEEINCPLNTCLGRMRYGLNNLRKIMVEKQLVL